MSCEFNGRPASPLLIIDVVTLEARVALYASRTGFSQCILHAHMTDKTPLIKRRWVAVKLKNMIGRSPEEWDILFDWVDSLFWSMLDSSRSPQPRPEIAKCPPTPPPSTLSSNGTPLVPPSRVIDFWKPGEYASTLGTLPSVTGTSDTSTSSTPRRPRTP